MKHPEIRKFLWITLFGIAFAMIESAVVIYLRELFYPQGFSFPLNLIGPDITGVEISREFATILLLISIAAIAAKTFYEGFAWFIYAFAIWDIFYYVFLYIFIGWPESLLTWDILFLIPFTWLGPVLAPLINSLSMILLAVIIIKYSKNLVFKIRHWILLIIGAIIIIAAYTKVYLNFMLKEFNISQLLFNKYPDAIIAKASELIPESFPWWIFIIGFSLHAYVLIELFIINKRHKITD